MIQIQVYEYYQYKDYNIMGKTKQQQRPKRKKLTSSHHEKQKMKQVLQKLAESKLKNQNITHHLIPITQMHTRRKVLQKKTQRFNKLNEKEHMKEKEKEIEKQQQIQQPKKSVVNIFAVDSFQAEKPVEVHNILLNKPEKMVDEADLQSRARKVMGESFNIQKFGEKPMRMIEQNNQPLVLSDDEDQPNSLKTITHKNIRVPEGNRSIKRKKEIEEIRQKLPIFMKEQQIIQTVNNHLVTLVCGETGSGKSTQLPQFLSEKNYQKLGKIGITQPRRLATISLARRVAEEMNFKIGAQIAYQVRHQRKQSQCSFIKFMTDGILLKQMSSDSLLLEYGVIIIDQAHERKLNTDILIGLLSKLILVRYKMSLENKCSPLRLIIMSATLRVSDFQNQKLFNFQVPILRVEAKMFPVTIFHQKNTPQNYVDCAVKKSVKIHKQLPPGDVLIFLTGKQQIHEASIKLEMALNRLKIEQRDGLDQQEESEEQIIAEGQYIVEEKPIRKNSANSSHYMNQFVILKLYSSLPIEEQDRIFKQQKPGCRKFIISTNIAETSITVPNIRYVIDSGQQKHRYFDNVWKWRKGWGSKAMAAQRSGRAGRTTHGYCYRLYSAALYANIMQEYPEPQISKLPLESVILEIKAIGFSNIFTFPFPTSPSNEKLKQSLQNLQEIGAVEGSIDIKYKPKQASEDIERQKQEMNVFISDNCNITELGKVISFIPLSPKLAKMLLLGNKLGLEKFVIIIAVLLTIESIFQIKFSHHKSFEMEFQYEDNLNKDKKNMLIEKKKAEMHQFNKKYSKYIDRDCGSDVFISMNIAGQFLKQIHKQRKNHSSAELYSSEHSIQNAIKSQSEKLGLNTNIMRQFYFNCDQISEIFESLTNKKIDLSAYEKPSQAQYSQILEILLSIYYKNLCRNEQNNRYINSHKQQIFINRMSIMYKAKHLFVGSIEFYENETNNRKYFRYPFKIENYQLLASFGLIKQPTEFQWKYQQVVGLTSAQLFGWQIPNIIVRDLKGESKYFAFARMLLAGDVVPSFKILSENKWLNCSLGAIRPDNLLDKVQRLVIQFRKHEIYSKDRLIDMMIKNNQFIKKELSFWLNVKNYDGVYKKLRQEVLNCQKQQK